MSRGKNNTNTDYQNLLNAARGEPYRNVNYQLLTDKEISHALNLSAGYAQWDVLNNLLSLKINRLISFDKKDIDTALLKAAESNEKDIVKAICSLPEPNQPTLRAVEDAIDLYDNDPDTLEILVALKAKLGLKNVDVNQSRLTQKIIQFMEIDSNTTFDETKKATLREGLCYGFSVVHSYMAATKKLNWWEDLLQKVTQWDGKATSLADSLTLRDSNSTATSTTLGSEINRVVNYVLYNFASASANNIAGMNNHTLFLKPQLNAQEKTARFDSMKGSINKYAVVAGNLSDDTLTSLLIPEFFSQEAIYLIKNINHACTLRCEIEGKSKKWYFYNPNYLNGEKEFINLSDLILEIKSILPGALSIEIASWSDRINIHEFAAFYNDMTTKKAQILLEGLGLHMIALNAPDQLPKLFELAETHIEIKNALTEAVKLQNKDDDWTGLHMIAQNAPDQLPALFNLAKTHDGIKNALAAAVQLQNKNGSTGLHIIALNAPDQLPALFELAKTHDGIKDAIAEVVKLKNRNLSYTKFFDIVKASELFKDSYLGPIMLALENIEAVYNGKHTDKLKHLINRIYICSNTNTDSQLETVIKEINQLTKVGGGLGFNDKLNEALMELSNQLTNAKTNPGKLDLDVNKISRLAAPNPTERSFNIFNFFSRKSPSPQNQNATDNSHNIPKK